MAIKCAVYVRKSTEHGLEQEFNSLQNQEEACKAYIASQAFNNWEYVRTYTDAALSGGTMERPALQQMLKDMEHGLINMVVVYKVDRLSRSILDFHNMMKEFEKYNANFVSITQAFDTSTSMGKLTLNMLLSFAQFEREVASERVRDKIRASKAKGIWMGGVPPLGYDIVNKKLVVNQMEATQVNELFEKYLELRSVNALLEYAEQHGIYGKKWQTHKGEWRGGKPIQQTSMRRLLRDKVYIGIVTHKASGTSAPGEHEPIVPTHLFEEVQKALQNNTNNMSQLERSPNILSGKLFNSNGIKFTNQRTCGKNKTNTLYYATKGFYLPAPQVDDVVLQTISCFLDSDLSALPPDAVDIIKRIDWSQMPYDRKRQFIQSVVDKIIYSNERLIMTITTDPIWWKPFASDMYVNEKSEPMDFITNKYEVIINVPVILRKYVNTRFDKTKNGVLTITDNNHLIVKAFATAWKYREMYERGIFVEDICSNEHTSPRLMYKHLALAYLSPKIINKLLQGNINMPVREVLDKASKYYDFDEQEKLFSIISGY